MSLLPLIESDNESESLSLSTSEDSIVCHKSSSSVDLHIENPDRIDFGLYEEAEKCLYVEVEEEEELEVQRISPYKPCKFANLESVVVEKCLNPDARFFCTLNEMRKRMAHLSTVQKEDCKNRILTQLKVQQGSNEYKNTEIILNNYFR